MRPVPRSMEARGAGAVAAVAEQRRAQPSGWWGALLLVTTEVTLFGCLIAAYFYLRFKSTTWPPGGIPRPSVTLPLLYTGMLVASCGPVFGAVRSARQGRVRLSWWLLAGAFALQGTYLGLQLHLFTENLDTFGPQANAYGSIYYALLGLHHAHVAIGLALDLWLLAKLLGGLTNYRLIALRVIALYWYFVSALGILVVLTQLYPSL
jgi:heme/copper-type cytochrome/quinol oxidase subunit 3